MKRRAGNASMREYAIVVALTLALFWLVFLVFGIARKEEIARHAVRDTKADLSILKQRQDTLAQNLQELSTERGQEAALRETFGVARPGEEVIIVVPPQGTTTPVKLPWWQQLFGWGTKH